MATKVFSTEGILQKIIGALSKPEVDAETQVKFNINEQLKALMLQVKAISDKLSVPYDPAFQEQITVREKIMAEHAAQLLKVDV